MKPLVRILLVITLVLLYTNCSSPNSADDDNDPPGRSITTGESTTVLSHDFGTLGGVETVDAPGEPVDGLEIDVPDDAYDSPMDMEISYAPIESHTFGSDFTPITPLITFDNGGVVSKMPITVKIPVSVSPDHFAMPFFYDPDDGSLGPMPILAVGDDYILAFTREFSDVVVSEIDIARLYGSTTIQTGFTPGSDGWQFPNEGSVLESGGICAGMSISALWYYLNVNPPSLYGEFENDMVDFATTDCWLDDTQAIKLSSVIQADPATWTDYAAMYSAFSIVPNDKVTWESLIYSMMWGDPQLLVVHSTADTCGHAIVAYGIDLVNYQVLVYDPNFPATTNHVIQYDSGTQQFDPYNSAINSTEPPMLFDVISLYFIKKLCDDGKLYNHWAGCLVGNIGDTEFPEYDVYMYGDQVDSVKLESASISTPDSVNYALSENSSFKVHFKENKYDSYIQLFEYDDVFNLSVDSLPYTGLTLQEGKNYIGVQITAKDRTDITAEWAWAGFEWYAIQMGPVIDEIVPESAEEGDTITIKGSGFDVDGNRYVWFDDQSADIVSWSDTLIQTVVPGGLDGEVPVHIAIDYKTSNSVPFRLAEGLVIEGILPAHAEAGDTVTVNGAGFGQGADSWVIFGGWTATVVSWSPTQITLIVPTSQDPADVFVYVQVVHEQSNSFPFTVDEDNILSLLQTTSVFDPYFSADCRGGSGDDFNNMADLQSSMTGLVWTGVNFSVERSETWTYGVGGEGTETETLNGTVSSDGRKILTMTYTYNSDSSAPAGEYSQASYSHMAVSIAVTDIDLEQVLTPNIHFKVQGPETQSHVTIQYSWVRKGATPGDPEVTAVLSSVNWSNPDDYPSYQIWFLGE